MTVSIKAYAKINLFLEVCEKRPDSYHNIDSIMQTVSLHDVITLSNNDSIILSNNKGLPNDETNLAYKAAKLFFDHTRVNGGVSINIEKNIPVSAGLAGGSTDAAAVLKGLNQLYKTELSIEKLCELGSKLGADVPFCIKGGTYITKGIGDVFTPCSPLPDCFLVITKNGEGVSTPFAYGQIDKSRENNNYIAKTSYNTSEALCKKNLKGAIATFYNAFEAVVLPIRPKVQEQKDILLNHCAVATMMSGSGPSVFGIFENEANAVSALRELIEYGAEAHLCKPIN